MASQFDANLVAKGQRVPFLGLLEQGRYHVKLGTKHHRRLGTAGWRRERPQEIADLIERLEGLHSEVLAARADSKKNRRREQRSVREAKSFKHNLVKAFAYLHSDGLVEPYAYEIVQKIGELRRSTPRISAYLADARPQVIKYDRLLSPFFPGQSSVALLDAVKGEVDTADGTQEEAHAILPLETLKIYEVKRRILTLIERMNRRTRIAFQMQPHILALLNKDRIRRAKKTRTKSVIEATVGGKEVA